MKSNYKPIGKYIRLVDERNLGLKVTTLLGLSISKEFIPSVANTIGSDMENYKIIRKNQFACSLMQVRRDKKIPVALHRDFEEAIISQAYPVFEVIDEDVLLPEYLMMWFSRSEFDRESCFYAVGGVRGSLEWEDFCNLQLPIPSLEKQKEIVAEYNTIVNRIKLNEQLNQKLEETAQAIYKQWFVDFEFPDENGKPYKSSGGEMEFCELLDSDLPVDWRIGNIYNVTDSIFSGGTPNTSVPEYWNGDFYWFSSGETRNLIVVQTEKTITKLGITESSTRLSKPDDLLIASAGVGKTRGQCSLSKVQLYINQSVICVRPKKFYYPWLFIFFRTRYSEIRNDSDAHSIRGSITTKDIGNMNIIIPEKQLIDNFYELANPIISKIHLNIIQSFKLIDMANILLGKMAKY